MSRRRPQTDPRSAGRALPRIAPDVIAAAGARALPPTFDEVREMYGPPRTLGATEEVRLAMDGALSADGGVYSLLQHSLQMGMGVFPQFMGYGALQNLAQNGLIRACVGTVADDMTREWIELRREGEGAADDGDLLPRLSAKLEQLRAQDVFHEAVELAGYEGGALVFLDTGEKGEALAEPLNVSPHSGELRPGSPLRLVAVDPVNVFPGDYNSLDPLAADYFRPTSWWVLGRKVHASRLLRVVGNEVPVLLRPAYNFLGIPQAQILWDYVLHFQDCRAAAARLLTKFSLTVFKTQMFNGIQFGSAEASQLDSRIRYLVQNMSNDGVLAVDKESEDVIKVETPLGGVTDIVRQALEFLAAVNRTPAVKLLGISPSGFNATGESDIRNYYDHIRSMQEKMLRGPLKTLLDCLQLVTTGDIDPTISFDFRPLGEEDRAALATMQKTRADTVAVYLDRGVVSQEEARKALADDPNSGFSDIDVDELPPLPDAELAAGVPGEEGQAAPLSGGDLDDVDKAGAVYG